ncbi:MAG: hypothetical protein ABSB67_07440 [Bryobacteraceae bacterium]|jgi:hypothetical protein
MTNQLNSNENGATRRGLLNRISSAMLLASCMAMTLAVPAVAETKIRIDSVPALYEPFDSMFAQPLSMSGYRFAANPENGRASVVIEYAYELIQQEYDGGPAPTVAEVPGLIWNSATRSVVYEANGQQTVCAVAQPGAHLKLKNTGSCTVTAASAEGPRSIALDTWLEVR